LRNVEVSQIPPTVTLCGSQQPEARNLKPLNPEAFFVYLFQCYKLAGNDMLDAIFHEYNYNFLF
jgi:hypothetical protein